MKNTVNVCLCVCCIRWTLTMMSRSDPSLLGNPPEQPPVSVFNQTAPLMPHVQLVQAFPVFPHGVPGVPVVLQNLQQARMPMTLIQPPPPPLPVNHLPPTTKGYIACKLQNSSGYDESCNLVVYRYVILTFSAVNINFIYMHLILQSCCDCSGCSWQPASYSELICNHWLCPKLIQYGYHQWCAAEVCGEGWEKWYKARSTSRDQCVSVYCEQWIY